jgi:hypothetical protein
MERFDWKMVFEGISTLAKAMPKDERLRRWVVIGTAAVVAIAALAASQCCETKSTEAE